MEGAEIARNCKIKNAIIDKHVKIPEGEIGYDADKDRERYETVTESGLVVIKKATLFDVVFLAALI